MNDPPTDWIKRLRQIAKEADEASQAQEDCCHGTDAQETLEKMRDTVLEIAKEIEQGILDALRASLR